MKNMLADELTPLEQPAAIATERRGFTIGLPASSDGTECRFPLTPEGANRLIERGFKVKMESGAANCIHYTDNQYMRAGCDVVDRKEALRADIVLHLAPLQTADIRHLRRGALVLTLLEPHRQSTEALRAMMANHTTAIALDLVEDDRGNRVFADILAEIDGRAAMSMAASLLADPVHGKGILLGGIAGINPCEVVILGSGIAACSAARTAAGMGAVVKMFDNDIYSLRCAARELGAGLICSDMHPRVVTSALRTADVIVATPTPTSTFRLNHDDSSLLKRGVLMFDLGSTDAEASVFPAMKRIELANATQYLERRPEGYRVCYVNAGGAVPRTCAMALSNTLITMLQSVCTCDGVNNALNLQPGLRKAAYLFLGHVVNEQIGAAAGIRSLDINLYLSLS